MELMNKFLVYDINRENFSNYKNLNMAEICVFDFLLEKYIKSLHNLNYVKKKYKDKLCIDFAINVCIIYFKILEDLGGNYEKNS